MLSLQKITRIDGVDTIFLVIVSNIIRIAFFPTRSKEEEATKVCLSLANLTPFPLERDGDGTEQGFKNNKSVV